MMTVSSWFSGLFHFKRPAGRPPYETPPDAVASRRAMAIQYPPMPAELAPSPRLVLVKSDTSPRAIGRPGYVRCARHSFGVEAQS